MPADAKQDRLPAAGPWTKYQSSDIPPGFRVVQQPQANVFDQFDLSAAGSTTQTPVDKWSAFPDASILGSGNPARLQTALDHQLHVQTADPGSASNFAPLCNARRSAFAQAELVRVAQLGRARTALGRWPVGKPPPSAPSTALW
ncbi:hypothetical protein BPNPMPFG_001253 [Mesorhizobium sp. AR07]|uniref:hypothetical protein n=1 Tax=Mesorhizobium sp. AR07 TaxID=2865838 RepID=UPI00215EFBD3|nr:hypothetical protein [Mesorhizobium sp. AR07]UVK45693.1 hypothetical protein BPNPMPFG_001253 [Mesorhizobium sp. AR07]